MHSINISYYYLKQKTEWYLLILNIQDYLQSIDDLTIAIEWNENVNSHQNAAFRSWEAEKGKNRWKDR